MEPKNTEPNRDDSDRKPNKFGLSLLVGVLFAIFVTSIHILMSTVPALVNGTDAPGTLGEAIVVFLFIAGIVTYGMQGLQNAFEELNKPRSRDEDKDDKNRRDNLPPM